LALNVQHACMWQQPLGNRSHTISTCLFLDLDRTVHNPSTPFGNLLHGTSTGLLLDMENEAYRPNIDDKLIYCRGERAKMPNLLNHLTTWRIKADKASMTRPFGQKSREMKYLHPLFPYWDHQ